MPNSQKSARYFKTLLLGATLLGGFGYTAAFAQDTGAAKPAVPDDSTVVVVTGYRASLRSATVAKKNSTNFTETIFSEDLGKFPDLNLAESMQRVPGMIVARDGYTGDGTQVSVRALPAAFTQVTMDGNRVAMASDFGFSGSSSPNRQVDLDTFPTGLFNRVDVAKTPSADQLEGGIAGTVNIQNARPFDRKGEHGVLMLQDGYSVSARASSPRLTGVWSKTWDKFGVLVGITSAEKKLYSDGLETLGWGDPSFNNYCGSCDPASSTIRGGSNQWTWGQTVYGYTGNGLTPGTLNEAQLLALNPGMTEATMKAALLPRLGRDYVVDGTGKNKEALVALEFRPSDNLKFNLDILGGQASRNAERSDLMLTVRGTSQTDGTYNGGMIPLNMAVDSNGIVSKATLANANFFEETNFYKDKTDFGSVNGSFEWRMTDSMKLDGNVAYMKSQYERDATFLKFLTPYQSTVTASYVNDPANDMPTITPSVDVNNVNLGWRAFTGQFVLQRDKRDVETKAAHINFTNEAGEWTFKAGEAYDTYTRHINIVDNTTAMVNAWNAAVPVGTEGKFLKAMTTPLYRDGVSGAGFNKFVTPDFGKIASAIGYDALFNSAATVDLSGSYNGAGASNISETINSAYMEALNHTTIMGVPVRSNFGVRWQNTDQVITSPSNINSQIVMVTTRHKYHDMLPSFNAVASVTDKLNIRFAASKTMTRANPSDMSSQLGYTDPSAQNASQGNPGLQPYYSDNLDLGGEYYTGKTGYVGLTFYSKNIKNFTVRSNIAETFSQLGIPFSSLGITQQTSLAGYAGHTVAEVTANPALVAGNPINLSTTVNLAGRTKLTGQEFMWVQPLDNFVDGLGYTVNYTHFGKSALPNIPDITYNLTAYYEHGGFSTHLSYVYVGTMLTGFAPSANNIPFNSYNEDRHQIDLSAAYKFKLFGVDQSITLDATNLDNQGFRNYATYKNLTNQFNNPGQTVIVGWRASY